MIRLFDLRRSLWPYPSNPGKYFCQVVRITNCWSTMSWQHHQTSSTVIVQIGFHRQVKPLLPMATLTSVTTHAHYQTHSNVVAQNIFSGASEIILPSSASMRSVNSTLADVMSALQRVAPHQPPSGAGGECIVRAWLLIRWQCGGGGE